MKRTFVIIIINILFVVGTVHALDLPDAKITIKAVDEKGVPVSGVDASITFEVPKFGAQALAFTAEKGMTVASGTFSASHVTTGYVSYGLKKEGYYESTGQFSFTQNKMGRWEPWDPEITLVFRKIIKPIPMYARNTLMSRIDIPAIGKTIGFDLMEFEWMPPYGNGKRTDFILKLDRKFISDGNFNSVLTITFSNKLDGIQLHKEDRKNGSVFKLPRYAPESGYQQKLTRNLRAVPRRPFETDYAEDNNYLFRIRSEERNGKLTRAMYGKIQGDITIDPRGTKTAAILFRYYLNPDYTRNLEYDPAQNLFKNLKDFERVGL